MSADYRVLIVDTRSGAVLDDLPFSGFTLNATVDWSRHDTMTVDVPLTGTDERRVRFTGIAFEPWKRSLCLVRNGAPVWAGPLITTSWGHTSVTFGCGGLSRLLDARMIFMNLVGSLTLVSSARDAIVRLFVTATDDGGAYVLPLDPQAEDGLGSLEQRSWMARDLPTIYESIKKIVEEDGAPDVRLEASLNANLSQLTWRARYGTPHLGRVDPYVAWDFPANIMSLTGDLDGSSLLTRGFMLGDGQEDDRVIVDATNSLTSQGYPVLERADRTAVSTRDVNVVKALADSYVAVNTNQASSWNVAVDQEYPGLDGWSLGDNAKFRVSGHWFLSDGEHIRRITGYTLTADSLALETTAPLI